MAIGKKECILYEFDFSLKDALIGLAEVNFYLGEYRQRVLEYKYAQYLRLDKERKERRAEEKRREREADALEDENQNEPEEGADKWEEGKRERESLAVFNHKRHQLTT